MSLLLFTLKGWLIKLILNQRLTLPCYFVDHLGLI
ncbi:Putative uncharacterized protein, partial [Moritella viscosa]